MPESSSVREIGLFFLEVVIALAVFAGIGLSCHVLGAEIGGAANDSVGD